MVLASTIFPSLGTVLMSHRQIVWEHNGGHLQAHDKVYRFYNAMQGTDLTHSILNLSYKNRNEVPYMIIRGAE